MSKYRTKTTSRQRRHRRVRSKIKGVASRPRLSVFRSKKRIWAQLIDDETGHTLVAASDVIKSTKRTKRDRALETGRTLAQRALAAGVTKVVFDRGGYKYHGRVKGLAEGAREEGLKF